MIVIPDNPKAVRNIFYPLHGETTLHIVTGYASATTTMWVLLGCDETRLGPSADFKFHPSMPRLQLLVGMSATGSVTKEDHNAFQQIERAAHGHVQIRYVESDSDRDLHSKLYVWSDPNLKASRAWAGSANFTMQGLAISARSQENHLHAVSGPEALDYALSRWRAGVSCIADDVQSRVPLESSRFGRDATVDVSFGSTEFDVEVSEDFYLYSRHRKQSYSGGAGVNWGIRTNRTSPDEAYIAIPNSVGESTFFPEKNTPFDVVCDDGEVLMLRGASGSARSGKDLSTWPANATLGAYLRNRLEVPSGELIQIEDLLRYGRTYVTISRLKNGEYVLDFSSDTARPDPIAESAVKSPTGDD